MTNFVEGFFYGNIELKVRNTKKKDCSEEYGNLDNERANCKRLH